MRNRTVIDPAYRPAWHRALLSDLLLRHAPGNNDLVMNNPEDKFSKMKAKDARRSLNQPKMERGKTGSTAADEAIQKNIETILALEKQAVKSRSVAEHIADRVTTYAGSAPFIVFHAVWFGGWIAVNERLIPGVKPFDPFPFSFLTLVVSLEAIFLTLLVLMSQNRMTKEADKRANLDLQINMLDEQETTLILRMVQKIASHLGLEEEIDASAQELCEETDVNRLAQKLDDDSKV